MTSSPASGTSPGGGGQDGRPLGTSVKALIARIASSAHLARGSAYATHYSGRVGPGTQRHAGVAAIQKERDRVAKEPTDARSQRDLALTERAALVATRGFLAFTDELAASTAEKAAALYRKGALPAPLQREFVEKLLEEDHRCICGTELIPDTPPWRHVTDWRQRAALKDVESAWQQLNGQITQLTGACAARLLSYLV